MVTWHPRPKEKSLADLTVVAEDISWTLDEVATATTLTVNHFLVKVNASGNTKITLPAAAYHTNRIYTIKNIHSTGTVTIDANSTEEIDGEETIVLKLQYSYVTIVCDGDEWFIIGGEYVKIEDLLNKKLTEQIDLLERIRQEATKITLHQASQSDENIGEKDAQ